MPRIAAILLMALTLAACGGDPSVSETQYADNCSAGGIWRAEDGTVAIIDDSSGPNPNRAHLVRPDGSQFVGRLQGVTLGSGPCFLDEQESGLYVALPVGQVLPDGSRGAEGRMTGFWERRRGDLDLQGTLDTTLGGTLELDFVGTYDEVHSRPSSVAMVAGTYVLSDGSGEEVLTVDSSGEVFSQNSRTGCVRSGTLVSPDRNFNIFRAALTYRSCQGDLSVLNGHPATGLATYDDRNSPAVLLLALDIDAPLQHYSTVATLDRS